MFQLYLTILNGTYAVFSVMRLFSYLPTIAKLRQPDADVRSYSVLTWGCWFISNLSFAMVLFETGGHRFDMLVAVPAANAFFCGVTCLQIIHLRARQARSAIAPLEGGMMEPGR